MRGRVHSVGVRGWLTAVASALLAATASPADALEVGQELRGHLVVGDKQVPLPRGTWTVAGVGVQDFDMAAIGAFGAIRNVVLFRREGTRVVAMAEINVNSIPVNDGWGLTKSCERGMQFLLVTRYKSGWDLSCMFVEPTAASPDVPGPPAWDAARRLAATAGSVLPELWLTVGYRMSDRQDLVDARYHFDPRLLVDDPTIAVDRADAWETEAVRASPARLAAVDALSVWAVGFDGWIERGVRNQLGGERPEMPQVAAFRSATAEIDAKLLALERLYRSGAIDAKAYVRQQRQALAEVPTVIEQTGGLPLSMQKNISFRVFGSSVDYFLAFAVTLSNPLSGAITATIVSIHSFIFVFNDNWWEDYWARRATRDAKRLVDFAYIGRGRT
ncbi:MAG: hypothetical protein IT561_19995 [Alphaproteobacteria bacterium]|nr:hypothetical protein [Alphaproteobacteria bacterium]